MTDSFKTRTMLAVGNQSYEIHSLPALQGHDLARLPDLVSDGVTEILMRTILTG